MWQRVLSFFGWLWAGFCFLGALGVAINGEFVTAIGYLIWGLIFLQKRQKAKGRWQKVKSIN